MIGLVYRAICERYQSTGKVCAQVLENFKVWCPMQEASLEWMTSNWTINRSCILGDEVQLCKIQHAEHYSLLGLAEDPRAAIAAHADLQSCQMQQVSYECVDACAFSCHKWAASLTESDASDPASQLYIWLLQMALQSPAQLKF